MCRPGGPQRLSFIIITCRHLKQNLVSQLAHTILLQPSVLVMAIRQAGHCLELAITVCVLCVCV